MALPKAQPNKPEPQELKTVYVGDEAIQMVPVPVVEESPVEPGRQLIVKGDDGVWTLLPQGTDVSDLSHTHYRNVPSFIYG